MHRVKFRTYTRTYILGVVVLAVFFVAVLSGSCLFDTKYTLCETGLVCPSGWACTAQQNGCTPDHCGDRVVDDGEQCDDGNRNDDDDCDSNCTQTGCGNGIRTSGEQCDDGNITSGDGCDSTCTPTGCGNGIRTSGEQCDDGNTTSGDGCSRFCMDEECGNGVLDPEEACDSGPMNSNEGSCTLDCTLAVCGDGKIYAGYEECDDNNDDNGDGCDSNCTPTGCGNGIVTNGEECDDGNSSNCGSCTDICRIAAPSKANGTIRVDNSNLEGQTVSINDGIHQSVTTFEFDNNAVVVTGNVKIDIAGITDVAAVLDLMRDKINASPLLIQAAIATGAGGKFVALMHERFTLLGNIAIGVSSSILHATGMGDGAGGDCPFGMHCQHNNDCKSNVCLSNKTCGCEIDADCSGLLPVCLGRVCVKQ